MQNSLKRINLILIFWAFAFIADAQKKIKHDISLAILNRSDMRSEGKIYGVSNKHIGRNYNLRYLAFYKKFALGIDKTRINSEFANVDKIELLPSYDYSYIPETYKYAINNYTALFGYEAIEKDKFSTILGLGYSFNYRKKTTDIFVDDYYLSIEHPPYHCEFNKKSNPVAWATIKYKFPKLIYWAVNFKYNYMTDDFIVDERNKCLDKKIDSIGKFNFLQSQLLIGISF